MHPKVINAYNELGYRVHVGNNMSFSAKIINNDGKVLDVGGGMCVEDISFWFFLKSIWSPSSMYIIGNAFGYSALNMAAIFENAVIDVIDAEIEGAENELGSSITRKISERHFNQLNLFKGFSPADIPHSRRNIEQTYDCCIVDGLHTPEQLKKDFIGIKKYLNESSLVYFHDAGTFGLYSAVEELANDFYDEGWKFYRLDFVPFGVAILCRGLDMLDSWFRSLLTPVLEWRAVPAVDNAIGIVGKRESIIYRGNLYNPTAKETIFCPDIQINLFRLCLLHCKDKNIFIYGARGFLAEKIIDFLYANAASYDDYDITFVDKAVFGSKIKNKWSVIHPDVLFSMNKLNVVIAAEFSGADIQNSLTEKINFLSLYPLHDVHSPEWDLIRNAYLLSI